MTTDWPQICASFSPSSRAEMSVAPPGGNGTMNLTGFCGQACAQAADARIAPNTKPRILFM
jgi:hypothetical protein